MVVYSGEVYRSEHNAVKYHVTHNYVLHVNRILLNAFNKAWKMEKVNKEMINQIKVKDS